MNCEQTEPMQKPATVLLVDDEQMILDVICRLFGKQGYHVIPALGGHQAVEEIRNNGGTIDIVILDMLMPGMNGEETFYRIREMYPEIPVVFASGYHHKDQLNNVLMNRCNGFVSKPYRSADLHEIIQNVLAKTASAGSCPHLL